MNSLRGRRDPRTGRVFGFQSEAQRDNFMIGRARFCNGLNREMPRCTALNRLGEPCKAARMRGQSTCFRHSGGSVKRARLTAARLSGHSEWAIEEAGVPDWLFAECYHAVGDFAETIALLLPPADASSQLPLHYWIEQRLLPLRDADDETRRGLLVQAWRELDEGQRFAWNKLITGEFRVGVSQSLVVRAVAEASGIAPEAMAHRLMGEWQPTAEFWRQLVAPDTRDADISRPYPFCLAYPMEGDVADLGDPAGWQIEWKWDGIRAQLIRRQWRTFLWSRGEELITDRFPELKRWAPNFPKAPSSTAKFFPGRMERRYPSPRCSGASAAKCWVPRFCRTFRWS